MREQKIVVSQVGYGASSIQELAQQCIELLILNRYTFHNPIHTSHTEPVSGGNES